MSQPPLSLYIHYPWCARKCPYCDFNSHSSGEDQAAYLTALLADLATEVERVQGRPLESIFIGGGTPSRFDPERVEQLLTAIRRDFTLVDGVEITLEANPGSVEPLRLAEFCAAGINRLSLGVQSFNDSALHALGRIHSAAQAEAAAQAALEAGFEAVNLDLMFALPSQTLSLALADLERAIALQPHHLSWYQLTIEPNTPFDHQPPPQLPDSDLVAEIADAGVALLAAAGYHRYEVSAYAREGFECRHNRNYWQFGDYLGIGAGAHGKLTDSAGTVVRTARQRHPAAYLAATDRAERISTQQTLSAEDLISEFMLNGLRLVEGVDLRNFNRTTGLPLSRIEPIWAEGVARGWLKQEGSQLTTTPLGFNFLNDVLQLFLALPKERGERA